MLKFCALFIQVTVTKSLEFPTQSADVMYKSLQPRKEKHLIDKRPQNTESLQRLM
jgi:hypothetical protein